MGIIISKHVVYELLIADLQLRRDSKQKLILWVIPCLYVCKREVVLKGNRMFENGNVIKKCTRTCDNVLVLNF